MKMFWKTQDRGIDKLLGAQRARQNAPERICREFDPDLANAYIEHTLTTNETARYELHLSECAPCRKSIVAIARLSAADTSVARPQAKPFSLAGEPQRAWSRLFGALTVPQWAMAAAAVIVVAISLPILLSQKQPGSAPLANSDEALSARSSGAPQIAQVPQSESLPGATASARGQAEQTQATSNQPKGEKEKDEAEKHMLAQATEPLADAAPAGAGSGSVAAAPPATESRQAKPDSTVADQTASRAAETSQPAAPAPSQGPDQRGGELARINPEEARRLPENKESAQVTPLSPSRPDAGQDAKKQEATITNKDSDIPPPPKPSSTSVRPGRGIATGSATRFRESRGEAPRGVAERKVGGKKFWLIDDIWTAKDYNPDKEMPLVTVFRDSEVYHELISKHSGMRAFLTGFTGKETVIFVYKGTVYKIVPQADSK